MSRRKGKGRQKGEQRQGVCTYCGVEGPITDDHVFPKVIFRQSHEHMVKVPACPKCQVRKSLGDRDLRTVIVLDIGGSTHPDAMSLIERMLRESNVRLKTWLRKAMDAGKTIDLTTDAGIVVGEAFGIEFNMERVIESQKMTARGLYFIETGTRLPPDAAVDVEYIPWSHAPGVAHELSAKTPFALREKGNRAAAWSFHGVDDHPPESSVIHIIYNTWVYFIATTGPMAENIHRRREQFRADHPQPEPPILEYPAKVVVPKDLQGNPFIPPS